MQQAMDGGEILAALRVRRLQERAVPPEEEQVRQPGSEEPVPRDLARGLHTPDRSISPSLQITGGLIARTLTGELQKNITLCVLSSGAAFRPYMLAKLWCLLGVKGWEGRQPYTLQVTRTAVGHTHVPASPGSRIASMRTARRHQSRSTGPGMASDLHQQQSVLVSPDSEIHPQRLCR